VAWERPHLAEDWNKVTTAASDERKNHARGRISMLEALWKNTSEVIEAFIDAIRYIKHIHVITATPENALRT
jgi:hypothetical protein